MTTSSETSGAASFGIAIPFYRDLAYLSQAVDSVLAQRDPDWRLWVVDDSGDPQLGEAVRGLVDAVGDPRIRYARNELNLGMVGSWNHCLDLADTPLLSLLHGDDRLLPGYVASLRALAEASPRAVAVYCGAHIIDAAGEARFSLADTVKSFLVPRGGTTTRLHGEPGATALMRGNFIMCPTLCFRLAQLGERRFDARWRQVQDLELTVRLLMEGEEIVGTAEPAYAYRRHDESATTRQSQTRLRFDEEFALFDEVARRADALGWSETARVARHKRIVKLHLMYRALRDLAGGRVGAAAETLRYLGARWR